MQLENLKGAPAAFSIYKRNHFAKKAYSNDISSEMGRVTMNSKLPYYMAYPMPLAYDDERVERMDLEYMKSLYPALAKRILPYIEEECDRMEYGNSVIYDEYPDRLQLQLMCGRIYENVRKNEERYLEIEKNAQLKDMIELMLYQELYNQRCRNRRTRNQFYINGSF